jgi:hypothetical protein
MSVMVTALKVRLGEHGWAEQVRRDAKGARRERGGLPGQEASAGRRGERGGVAGLGCGPAGVGASRRQLVSPLPHPPPAALPTPTLQAEEVAQYLERMGVRSQEVG